VTAALCRDEMKIELPNSLIEHLGAPMAMDVHWVDLKLKSGKVIKKVVIRDGRFISGQDNDRGREEPFDLEKNEILGLRRFGLLPLGRFTTIPKTNQTTTSR